MQKYEVYVEEFRILEWKDDSVYKTESLGHKWIPEDDRTYNIPEESGVFYADANDEFSKSNVCIRRAK